MFAQELMARMRECIERDRGTTPEGIPYVPLSMAENESYKPQTGCATIARVAFHGEFEPDDRIVTDLLRLIDACDDREGIPECTGWRSDQSIYTYSSVRFAQLLLQAGQREKAADYLYAFCQPRFSKPGVARGAAGQGNPQRGNLRRYAPQLGLCGIYPPGA